MNLEEAREHYKGLREDANQAGQKDIANVYTKALELLNGASTTEEAKDHINSYKQRAITGVQEYMNEVINNLD